MHEIVIPAERDQLALTTSRRHVELTSITRDQRRRFHPPKRNEGITSEMPIDAVEVKVRGEAVVITDATLVQPKPVGNEATPHTHSIVEVLVKTFKTGRTVRPSRLVLLKDSRQAGSLSVCDDDQTCES
jgi:hypothetical protein